MYGSQGEIPRHACREKRPRHIKSSLHTYHLIPFHPFVIFLTTGKHSVRGSDELMEKAMLSEKNLSVRMTEVIAAIIRPQLANFPERLKQYSRRYREVRLLAQERCEAHKKRIG